MSPFILKTPPKPSHTPLLSETVGNLGRIELWGRKRGTGWCEKKRKLHMPTEQVSGGGALCKVTREQLTPLYMLMRLSPLVPSRISTDSPVTLSIPGKTEKKQYRRAEERKDGSNRQDTRVSNLDP